MENCQERKSGYNHCENNERPDQHQTDTALINLVERRRTRGHRKTATTQSHSHDEPIPTSADPLTLFTPKQGEACCSESERLLITISSSELRPTEHQLRHHQKGFITESIDSDCQIMLHSLSSTSRQKRFTSNAQQRQRTQPSNSWYHQARSSEQDALSINT